MMLEKMLVLRVALIVSGLVRVVSSEPLPCEVQELVGSDAAFGDNLGSSVAIQGGVAVFGAPQSGLSQAGPGAAYIFRFDPNSVQWGEEQRLIPSDSMGRDHFGLSVAIAEDVAIVGAPHDAIFGTGEPGSAYVFRYDPANGKWEEEQELVAPDGDFGDQFGHAVATDGEFAVVTARLDDDPATQAGSAHVFRYDNVTGQWEAVQKLMNFEGAGFAVFGSSVAISADVLVVGASVGEGVEMNTGAAYVFRLDPDRQMWMPEQKLIASDGEGDDRFGGSVAIDGELIVVGAEEEDGLGSNSGAAYVYRFDEISGLWLEEQKLNASDGAANDEFGRSVAVHGELAIVGAWFDDDLGFSSGSAYVFDFDADVPGWVERDKLTASNGASGDHLGIALAVDDLYILLGARRTDGACPGNEFCNSGSVYSFALAGSDTDMDGVQDDCDNCVEIPNADQSDFDGDGMGDPCDDDDDDDEVSDASDNCPLAFNPDQADADGDSFGDVCDNCVLVLNPEQTDANGNSIGEACEVFACESVKLIAANARASSDFGEAVSVSGDVVFVGSARAGDGAPFAGSVSVFGRTPGTSEWVLEQLLTASDAHPDDRFGTSVSVDGQVAVVGAIFDDSDCPMILQCNSGAAYVFRFDPAISQWVEEQKLLASDQDLGDQFGQAVAVRGDTAVIGAVFDDTAGENAGAAYVFRYSSGPGGPAWKQVQKLIGLSVQANDTFGISVSLSDDAVFIGSYERFSGGAGSVYVFRRNDDGPTPVWIEEQRLTASDGALGDEFGVSVSAGDDLAVVGAFQLLSQGPGAAYVYRYDSDSLEWVEEAKLSAPDPSVNDRFGSSVSLSGNAVVVGAERDDSSGVAYVYRKNDVDTKVWAVEQKLTASDADGGDEFGGSVALFSDVAVVGAPGDSDVVNDGGAAYIFAIGPDAETDGFVDDCDNCASVANPEQGDCNADGVGDACVEPGDFDGDGTVGVFDFADFLDCFGGIGVPPAPGEPSCVNACRLAFDFDGDGDVDWNDFGALQTTFAGP